MSVVFAYLAPAKYLPLTSVLMAVAGLALLFGRSTLRLVSRWARPAK